MKKNLKGLKILVTAGPTREHFDPIRFLSNPSSGKMGYAIAEAAKRGACDFDLGPHLPFAAQGVQICPRHLG